MRVVDSYFTWHETGGDVPQGFPETTVILGFHKQFGTDLEVSMTLKDDQRQLWGTWSLARW